MTNNQGTTEDLARWELAVIIAGIIGLIVALILSMPALINVA